MTEWGMREREEEGIIKIIKGRLLSLQDKCVLSLVFSLVPQPEPVLVELGADSAHL